MKNAHFKRKCLILSFFIQLKYVFHIFLYSKMADKKDDLPWGADGFRLKNVRIRPTVRRKIEEKLEHV